VLALQEEYGAPALAFVKTVCTVFALDAAVADELAVMRRQLLRLVHCPEFAPAAVFRVRWR
jgi:DNA polymerase epsilon subunit 1